MESNLIQLMFRKLLEALKINAGPKENEKADVVEARKKEAFSLVMDGITIRGTIIFPVAHPARQYPTLIICHGIPGSGATRPRDDPGYEGLAQQIVSSGIAAAIFNFRGCGDSGGNFDILGWTRDLEGVIDKILNTPYIDPTRIMVLGFSGGGAAAIYVAANNPAVYSLAVVGTPASFEIFEKDPDEIIKDFKERGLFRNPDFPNDVSRWIKGFEEIKPSHWVSHFKGKHLLIVQGDADELIPIEHAQEIFDHAPAGIAELSIITGGVHRLRMDQRCIKILEKWFLATIGWK